MGIVVHIVDASLARDLIHFENRASKKEGDIVIALGAMCNGVVQALSDTLQRASDGSVDALIFYGHGPDKGGAQGVSMGQDAARLRHNSAITVGVLSDPVIYQLLVRLRRKFSPGGSIVLRGCHAARGELGKELLRRMSLATGVIVKGSDWYQIVGRSDLAGNIVTASPDGRIVNDHKTGLMNLGGYPPEEGLYLLGREIGLRLKAFSNKSAIHTGN